MRIFDRRETPVPSLVLSPHLSSLVRLLKINNHTLAHQNPCGNLLSRWLTLPPELFRLKSTAEMNSVHLQFMHLQRTVSLLARQANADAFQPGMTTPDAHSQTRFRGGTPRRRRHCFCTFIFFLQPYPRTSNPKEAFTSRATASVSKRAFSVPLRRMEISRALSSITSARRCRMGERVS